MFDLGTAVGYLMLDTSGFTSGIGKAESGLKAFIDKSNGIGGQLGGLGSALSSIGGTLTKSVTLPLVGAGTALVSFASEGDSAFSHLQAKVGDVTQSMDQYRSVMDDVYKNNYGESMMDVADAMGDIVNTLGELSGDELQEVTESALALRDTFGYEVGESIRTVDTLMKNFGVTSQEAFDFIVKGQQEGLDFSGEFLDTLNEYSVQFGKLGFSAEDMFNVLKQGADSGAWNLDKVGDAIKEFSIRAIDGSDTTIAGFEALGFSADDMAARFAAGGDTAKEAFQEVIDGLANMDDPVEQSIAGVNLFGTMWEDLGPEVVTQLSDITGEVTGMKGAMDKLKEVKYDNLESALGGLGRSLQVAGASLGKYLIPYVEEAIEFVDGLVEKFDSLDPSTKEIAVKLGLVAAAIGPILLVGGKLITGVVSAISTISKISGLISSLPAVITALTGPIGIVIAAVAAFAVAWATDFGGIRETTQEIMQSIQEIISSIWDTIVSLWNDNFLGIQDIAKQAWELIQQVFSDAMTIIVDTLNVFKSLFSGDWGQLWEDVKQLFSDVWNAIMGLLGGFLDLIVDTIIRIGVRLWDAASEAFNNIMDAFRQVWDSIMSWLEGAVQNPVDAIKSIGTSLYNAGVEIFTSLWDGLKSIWSSISGWVSDAIDWLKEKVAFWESESAKIKAEDRGPSNIGGGFGSHAAGLDYVPYNGYRAELHEGERVLTKQENEAYGRESQARVYVTVYNTQPVDSNTAKRVSKEIGRETAKELRGRGIVVI